MVIKQTVARGQNLAQKQSQRQNVNVNINLGEKKKKGKPKKRKTGKRREGAKPLIIPAFNPPPIINYPPAFQQQNQPNNWFNPPPPIPQKQYSVFPEAETATTLNLLSNVPVPLKVEGSPLKEKAKEVRLVPEQYTVINEPFKPPEKEEYTLIQPAEAPPTFEAEQPALFPVGEKPLSAEENALKYILEFGTPPVQPFKQPPATETLLPEEPPSPTASTISSLSGLPEGYSLPLENQPLGEIAPSLKDVFGLSKVSQSLPLPPIGPSAQPLTSSGLTTYTQPSNFPPEYVFEEGATAPAKKKKGLAVFIEGAPEPVKEEKKKRGAPKGPRQPKYDASVPAGQAQFAVPVKETEAFPIPAQFTAEGAYSLSAPLSQQPSAVFLGGSEKTFSTEPPPEKVSGLQRQRRVIERATAITPAEQNILLNP